jgi:hypothetical protein
MGMDGIVSFMFIYLFFFWFINLIFQLAVYFVQHQGDRPWSRNKFYFCYLRKKSYPATLTEKNGPNEFRDG